MCGLLSIRFATLVIRAGNPLPSPVSDSCRSIVFDARCFAQIRVFSFYMDEDSTSFSFESRAVLPYGRRFDVQIFGRWNQGERLRPRGLMMQPKNLLIRLLNSRGSQFPEYLTPMTREHQRRLKLVLRLPIPRVHTGTAAGMSSTTN
ncbi:hypothetical protein Hypma_005602 [Hypsizygus marmoreus]|uniref:Uncharacterized protein n=1 Tax=Hypsizygus marmoreus TaxID=39966 RepID=A0A369JVY5_HYPMA|nr:hypothetical protein Hypma_005602 [Hypsizygus marmoreus]